MAKVKESDTVSIVYIGKLDNGHIFKEVHADDPLTVILGKSELPPTVELAIIGMEAGNSKKIRIAPDEGYGPRFKDLLHELPVRSFGNRLIPKPGMVLSQKVTKDGKQHTVPATVIEVKNDNVVVDYNHPLAGHHLTYELTVIEINPTG